jgi:V8-like Glu-specific endopeptidase
MRIDRRIVSVMVVGCALALHLPSSAQVLTTADSPIEHVLVPVQFDTGEVQNHGQERGVAYSAEVRVPRRSWIRLQFSSASLGRTPPGGQPTVLRISSLLDGGTQTMNTEHLRQWNNSTAYFNGDAVRLEIICDPDAPPSRVTMNQLIVGSFVQYGEGGIATICGSTDDRVLSNEAGNARMLPPGCTAWLINDPNRTFLTAGHCVTGLASSVIQFNVPLSTPGGATQNPPPEHQYAPDLTSLQSLSGGIGQDYAYFGCFPNPVTNLTPFQAQGAFYTIAAKAPPVANPAQQIRITGYGSTSAPVSPTWYLVQKTHTGLYTQQPGTTVNYATDTTGGNSGSPVFNLDDNTAIGIHTHGGCTSTGGQNSGTAIEHPGLQNALANPLGVCIPRPLNFSYPDGRPANINPAGDTLRVEVLPGAEGPPLPGSGQLHVDLGSGFVPHPMNEISPNVYDAVFPESTCGTLIRYRITAQSATSTVPDPISPAGAFYTAVSAVDVLAEFDDNFQTNQGWTTSNTMGVLTGFWQRVTPTATGSAVPQSDADGSGMCYVTDNAQGADIDGGSVTLTSPVMDATGTGAAISYWRWFDTSQINTDTLLVQVSDNGGSTWVNLESFSSTTGAWVKKDWTISQIAGITPTNQFRIRFTATDAGSGSTVEAGVDGVKLTTLECGGPSCLPDVNNSGAVDVDDLIAVILEWGCVDPPGPCDADVDGDGIVGVDDLIAVILAWGPCP